eukprot:GFUD01028650.1.p1 GENE.GFUD01028650.1~~GFUD01028650.1.p1  ORF type:complete len:404 (+),score=110.26 GFUD01028650.1:55-1266(+)
MKEKWSCIMALILMTGSSLSTLSPCTTICSNSPPPSTSCYGGSCLQLDKTYNRFSIPVSRSGKVLEVKLGVALFSISNIDVAEGSIEVELGLQLNWQDERMRVCQCKERNIRKLVKLSEELEDEIWLPELVVLDVLDVEKEVGLSKHGGIRLVHHENSTGVIWDMRINAVINCYFVATWFPFDSNLCLVRLGSDLHPTTQLNISMDKLPGLKVRSKNGFKYTLGQLEEVQSRYFPLSKYSKGQFRCAGFKIGITRDGGSIVMQYAAVMGILITMTCLTVIWPSTTVDRLGPMAVTIIGVLTIYTTVNLNYPPAATGLHPLVLYVLIGLGICYLFLLEFVVVLIIRKHHKTWVERIDQTFLVVGLISWVCCTVFLWMRVEFLANSCEEGFGGDEEGVCYHNLDV